MTMEEKDVIELFDGLKNSYGFNFDLKKEQIDIVLTLMNRRNVFGFLPTGYGKSLCYVLPPLILDELDWSVDKHICVVISPLKSLMKDQVDHLTSIGVKSVMLHPDIDTDIYKDIGKGMFSLLFMSPEMAVSKQVISFLLRENVSKRLCLLACDEAHCISEWGDDFRPTYKEIVQLRSIIQTPVIALTGTCDEKIRRQIFKTLELNDEDTCTIARIPDRRNISLSMKTSKQDFEELSWIIKALETMNRNTPKIIVYCRSVNNAAAI